MSAITYVDVDGVTQTIDAADYHVSANPDDGTVECSIGVSWPTSRGLADDVVVEFVCGYGAASAVPDDIVDALLLWVGAGYENREDFVVGTITSPLPKTAADLLFPYRIPRALVAA